MNFHVPDSNLDKISVQLSELVPYYENHSRFYFAAKDLKTYCDRG